MEDNIKLIEMDESHYKYFVGVDKDFTDYLGYPEFTSTDDVKHYMESKQRKRWVIDNNGTIVGIMYTYEDSLERWKKCSLAIGILEGYRGKNLAKEAITKLVELLIEKGYTRLQVDIELTNKASLALIKKMHMFEYEGTMKNYWGKGNSINMYSYTI